MLRLTIETKPTHALHCRPHTKFKHFVTFVRCLFLFWCLVVYASLAIYAAYSTHCEYDAMRTQITLRLDTFIESANTCLSYDLSHTDCIYERNQKQLFYCTHTSLRVSYLCQSKWQIANTNFNIMQSINITEHSDYFYSISRNTHTHNIKRVFFLSNKHTLYCNVTRL